jgi:uncharacterized tellurite resistance protein B-like protein
MAARPPSAPRPAVLKEQRSDQTLSSSAAPFSQQQALNPPGITAHQPVAPKAEVPVHQKKGPFPAAATTPQSSLPSRGYPPAASFRSSTPPGDVRNVQSNNPSLQPAPAEFRVPPTPKGFGSATWVPAGQSISVAGMVIPGGMVYVGTRLPTPLNDNDPCLIDPSKPVASRGDYTDEQMGYWPSYGGISAQARHAYLSWLAGGRTDPDADIGYVFLFFYGLERRAILDAAKDDAAKTDWPVIANELRRLLAIYGDKSHSFRSYAGSLLDWASLAELPEKAYAKPVPTFPKSYELPLYIRLALGQAAVDGAPVPAELALAWVRLDPTTYLRTPASRCEEEFDELFICNYRATFGDGLLLPRNRTKLKLVHRPASAGFRGHGEAHLHFGDVPDVTVLTAPIKKLHQVVEMTTKELDAFSRYVGKNPEERHSLEGLLHLPVTLWPEKARSALRDVEAKTAGGMAVTSLQELMAKLGATKDLTRDKIVGLARVLESVNVGIEPDVLSGSRMPKADEKVVLFAVQSSEATSRTTPAYQAAVLTLQFASAVASADGEFGIREMGHLREQIQSWKHLTPNHVRRLLAHLRLLVSVPASLPDLKRKLQPLDEAARKTIAAFMVAVVQSDGSVSPAEVKMLQKVYKALGVDSGNVFSDLHAVATGGQTAPLTEVEARATGFRLDHARIAALQKETEAASALLADIFREEEPVPSVVTEVDNEVNEQPRGLLGLDEPHSALARMLLSRPEWSREELVDVAADLDLMLDGALEHINEAAFDTHDMPFFEGSDPVTVNSEILEKVEA